MATAQANLRVPLAKASTTLVSVLVDRARSRASEASSRETRPPASSEATDAAAACASLALTADEEADRERHHQLPELVE